MDPVTAIVAALALGAASAAKDVAATAVKDAYAALKTIIVDRYHRVDVAALEKAPQSENRRAVVAEDLRDSNAGADPELAKAAAAVVETVQQHAPEIAAAIGVDLKDVQAANLRLKDIEATGSGVRVERGTFSGDIDISGVRAGKTG